MRSVCARARRPCGEIARWPGVHHHRDEHSFDATHGEHREATEQLLGDEELRARLGGAARERARERFAWPAATEETVRAYRDALS